MALNAKHILFVNDYMVSHNVTESYQKVYGCSEEAARKNGSRLMTNDDIKSEIERRQKEVNEKIEKDTGVSVQWVVDNFKYVAERCMAPEPLYDKEGNIIEWRFDSSGANKALESIGKYLGMFKDKGDSPISNNTVNLTGLSLEELRKLAKSKPA